ncbi:uncharacterized protein KY384_003956 [Bacidia gigantensis]|uniref:uncharacterized protein n=1 Tax=Bacidia gigantensis TaxID=2732470 RepID=UPI001D0596CC|nr:uncharacterized protein KY384_003956 [Bacidia gigantensis]KAG8532315.1 hypothetical protein KY384_003956 [Bacidia gigantensis]
MHPLKLLSLFLPLISCAPAPQGAQDGAPSNTTSGAPPNGTPPIGQNQPIPSGIAPVTLTLVTDPAVQLVVSPSSGSTLDTSLVISDLAKIKTAITMTLASNASAVYVPGLNSNWDRAYEQSYQGMDTSTADGGQGGSGGSPKQANVQLGQTMDQFAQVPFTFDGIMGICDTLTSWLQGQSSQPLYESAISVQRAGTGVPFGMGCFCLEKDGCP